METAKIRIGKDFTILWRIYKRENGEKTPYMLTAGKEDYTLRLWAPYGKQEITRFEIDENTIQFDFLGKDQKHLGNYSLELVERKNAIGMVTVDTVGFTLVAFSRYETEGGNSDVVIQDVKLESELGLTPIVSLTIDTEFSETSHNAVSNYVITEKFKQVDDKIKVLQDAVEALDIQSIEKAIENKADKTSLPTKTSQLTNDSGFIKAEEVPAPDWNASTYKEGHIKNRTHHMQDYMCQYFKGSPIKISKPSDVGYVLLAYDTDLPEKFIRIEIKANESKTEEFLDAMGMPLIFTWDAGNSTINVQSFGGAIETYGMRAYYSSSAKSYDEYFVALDEGFIPEEVARKRELKTINGESILGKGNIVIEGGEYSHNIGSIDLFEQIIAERRNHNLTQEDKDAILNGKIITTSVGNGVVPTISSNTMGENGAVLIFHFNERLYEMFVMWTDTLCYINGVLSFARESKLYADSELSETSENSVQNKVVTEKLTELSAEKEDKTNKVTSLSDESTDVQYPSAKIVYNLIKLLKERIEEQDQFIEDLQNTKIEKENDDYYPNMAVGLADNLAGVDVVDSEINFRRSGGGAISDGVARIESIKGNSVVWNQVFKPNINAYGSQFVKTEDDGLTMEAIKEPSEKFLTLYNLYMGIASHKYFLALDVVSGSYTEGETRMEIFGNLVQPNVPLIIALSEAKKIGADLRIVGCIGMRFRVRVVDLTQMFGAGNEPTTIEEFYARIPMGVDLNAYNEGEVIHMDVQSIESQGVNAWDEEWVGGYYSNGNFTSSQNYVASKNPIKVIAGQLYYFSTKSINTFYVTHYDENLNYIGNLSELDEYGRKVVGKNAVYTIPQGVTYIKIFLSNNYGSTYNHDICINISDASINGKYFPYIKRVEDLSLIRKYFPDGMKSAGSAHDEIRYNKASGKWEKVQRIGEVKMKDLKWVYNASTIFSATISGMYIAKNNDERKDGILSAKYGISESPNVNTEMSDKSILRESQIYLRDTSYSDDASLKASFTDDDILYYELAEPIVTELDAEDQFKDLDYQVWNCGTEKAIADGKSAPLAADITYGFNAIGKIKELEEAIKALQTTVASL